MSGAFLIDVIPPVAQKKRKRVADKTKAPKKPKVVKKPPTPKKSFPVGIYVDGGANKATGLNMAWAVVTDEKGQDLLGLHPDIGTDFKIEEKELPGNKKRHVALAQFDDVKVQDKYYGSQNNGAELIAMVLALRICQKHEWKAPQYSRIFSDSQVVVAWASGRAQKDTLAKMDARKKALIDEACSLHELLQGAGGEIVKISGDDNPSDLGYHKKKTNKPKKKKEDEREQNAPKSVSTTQPFVFQ